jgi:hypothetical protein
MVIPNMYSMVPYQTWEFPKHLRHFPGWAKGIALIPSADPLWFRIPSFRTILWEPKAKFLTSPVLRRTLPHHKSQDLSREIGYALITGQ